MIELTDAEKRTLLEYLDLLRKKEISEFVDKLESRFAISGVSSNFWKYLRSKGIDILLYIDHVPEHFFESDTNLRAVNLGNNIINIYPFSFRESSVTSVVARDVAKVELMSFSWCTDLREVYLDNCTSIGPKAFLASSVEKIYCPNVKLVGAESFKGCRNLQEFNFDNVKSVEPISFGNTSVESLKSNLIISIGAKSFENCQNLHNIELTNENLYIYNSAFNECKNIQRVVLPIKLKRHFSKIFKNSNIVSVDQVEWV